MRFMEKKHMRGGGCCPRDSQTGKSNLGMSCLFNSWVQFLKCCQRSLHFYILPTKQSWLPTLATPSKSYLCQHVSQDTILRSLRPNWIVRIPTIMAEKHQDTQITYCVINWHLVATGYAGFWDKWDGPSKQTPYLWNSAFQMLKAGRSRAPKCNVQ